MPKCSFYAICGRDVEGNPQEGLCILHSTDSTKDECAFTEALEEHRKDKEGNFAYMVFPKKVDFSKAKFATKADFHRAGFSRGAFFSEATFAQGADFRDAIFTLADFHGATFDQGADFSRTKFCETAVFVKARFIQGAIFDGAVFMGEAYFGGATFLGKTLFAFEYIVEDHQTVPIFSSVAVDFRGVTINPPDAIIFRGADLRKCQFLDTDLRKVQMIGVTWPQIPNQIRWPWIKYLVDKWPRVEGWMERLPFGHRIGVYDEIYALGRVRNEVPLWSRIVLKLLFRLLPHPGRVRNEVPPWSRIEELYRQLKQSYEDRRDYERAGDFHYGEKEMRRKNQETSCSLWSLLILYWLVSGYGERILRPLLCALVLFTACTLFYLWCELRPAEEGYVPGLTLKNVCTWGEASLYSLQVMILFRPQDYLLSGWVKLVYILQSLLGPLLFGLFALAVRQKLKR